MKNFDARITALVNTFVHELTSLAREAARATIDAALESSLGRGAGRPPRAAAGAGSRTAAPTAPARGRRAKGAKRSADEIVETQDRLLAYVSSNPGLRIEQINKELGTVTSDVALPLRKLIADGVLRTEGARRATKYFPGTGQRRAPAKRGRKKKA